MKHLYLTFHRIRMIIIKLVISRRRQIGSWDDFTSDGGVAIRDTNDTDQYTHRYMQADKQGRHIFERSSLISFLLFFFNSMALLARLNVCSNELIYESVGYVQYV